jgi:hypothetical protein
VAFGLWARRESCGERSLDGGTAVGLAKLFHTKTLPAKNVIHMIVGANGSDSCSETLPQIWILTWIIESFLGSECMYNDPNITPTRHTPGAVKKFDKQV